MHDRSQARPCILVVEDDADLRAALESALRDEGYRVVSARDGAEAFQKLRQPAPPDLVLLDLMMPGMNGWEFRARQRQDPVLARIPVVVISAGVSAQEMQLLGAAAVHGKPVELDALCATIRRHCGHARGSASSHPHRPRSRQL